MTHRWLFKGAWWLAWWQRTGEIMIGSIGGGRKSNWGATGSGGSRTNEVMPSSNEGVANQIGAQLAVMVRGGWLGLTIGTSGDVLVEGGCGTLVMQA
ncbi:unnamed protein product [Sphenostylis stenocarpa]|uniref:Uncharacterized protein n=1 Tax=Sphenostylis stenocarpa TaxID=92480 RepID=A0AA86S940_9FABA|nr:unnamed protein product [Sphenostylis stenocarpa]